MNIFSRTRSVMNNGEGGGFGSCHDVVRSILVTNIVFNIFFFELSPINELFRQFIQGARYLALKIENNDLPLPAKVVKASSKQSKSENPGPSSMPPFVIVILVCGSFLLIGVLYKGKTVGTKLWRTDDDPGQRQTPIGQEER